MAVDFMACIGGWGANLGTRHLVLEDLETISYRLSASLDLHCILPEARWGLWSYDVSETPFEVSSI